MHRAMVNADLLDLLQIVIFNHSETTKFYNERALHLSKYWFSICTLNYTIMLSHLQELTKKEKAFLENRGY